MQSKKKGSSVMTSKSWLFEQIPDLSKIVKKMSLAGILLTMALVLTDVVDSGFS